MNTPSSQTLLQALKCHDFKTIKRCLEKGEGINAAMVFKAVMLQESGDKERFLSLMVMKDKSDPNLADAYGTTALHIACATDKSFGIFCCHLLIQAGADVNAVCDNRTPFDFALISPYRPHVRLLMLLSAGADPRKESDRNCYQEEVPLVVKKEVRRWLQCLQVAKTLLKPVLNNEALENEIIGFVHNETCLKNLFI